MSSLWNSLFGSKSYEDINPKKIQACCPQCKYQFEMEIKYKISIEVEQKLTTSEIRNLEYQQRSMVQEQSKKYTYEDKSLNDNKLASKTLVYSKHPTPYSRRELSPSSSLKSRPDLRQEQQRLEQQRLEQQRREQLKLEQQRLEQQRLEQQRLEQQRLEQQRLEREQQRLKIPPQPLTSEEFAEYKMLINDGNFNGLKTKINKARPDTKVFDYALFNSDNFQLFDLLLGLKCPMDSNTFLQGVKTGSKVKIDYLIKNNCPYQKSDTVEIYTAGLSYGLDFIKFLKSKPIPMPNNIIELAIGCGNSKSSDIIEWLLSTGVKFTSKCFEAASEKVNIALLDTLKKHNCEWGELSFYNRNKIINNPEIHDWFKKESCPWFNE